VVILIAFRSGRDEKTAPWKESYPEEDRLGWAEQV
jgi:hypothetical protein